jgi:uncharacterized protein
MTYNVVTMSFRQSPIDRQPASPGPIRPEIITDEFVSRLREHGVDQAYLFGSVARGDERLDSDIDLLVSFRSGTEPGQQFLLAEDLSRLTGRRVDVATRLHPAFAPFIEPTLVPLLP